MDSATKKEIDAQAVEMLNKALKYSRPIWELVGDLNGLRGMCADGCCGGVQEVEHPTQEQMQVHAYVGRLINRAQEII